MAMTNLKEHKLSLTIHFGIRVVELGTFSRQVQRLLPEPIDIHTDRDDWNQWGLPLVGEVDADTGVHVEITTMTPMIHLNFLVGRMLNFLVPNNEGLQLIVTDAIDDDAVYLELTYPDVINVPVPAFNGDFTVPE